jgi:hypothetical protein
LYPFRRGSFSKVGQKRKTSERPSHDTRLPFRAAQAKPKAAAKHLICLDLAFPLFRSWKRSTVYPEWREGLRPPFGREMHPKKRTLRDLDRMIWPAARIR